MALVTRAAKGAPLTATDHDSNLTYLEGEIARLRGEVAMLNEAISSAVVSFDANGSASAPRPVVPPTATIFWINSPTEPVNMGPLDLWVQEQS